MQILRANNGSGSTLEEAEMVMNDTENNSSDANSSSNMSDEEDRSV